MRNFRQATVPVVLLADITLNVSAKQLERYVRSSQTNDIPLNAFTPRRTQFYDSHPVSIGRDSPGYYYHQERDKMELFSL